MTYDYTNLPANIANRIQVDANGCWLFTGCTRNGYGRALYDGKVRSVHRTSYMELVGEIPAGCEIDHLCRVKACCNPEHLEAVTHRVNVLRGAVMKCNGRPPHVGTACRHGHEYVEGSYYLNKKGHRKCKTCRRATVRKWREKNKIQENTNE